MTITITPITPTDILSAVECIQLAFSDDPYAKWVFNQTPGKFNLERNFHSLKIKCEWGIRNALFYVAKDTAGVEPDKVVGVSMWMKPQNIHQQQSWGSWIDGYVLWFKQGLNLVWYGGRGGLRTSRYWIWKREQAIAQQEIWTDSEGYYFCNIVTVRPGVQGKGIGRKLFGVVTDMADQEGRCCYLESSRDIPNTAIYEKLGFKMAKKMVCEEDGDKCDLFCMIREPRELATQTGEANASTAKG